LKLTKKKEIIVNWTIKNLNESNNVKGNLIENNNFIENNSIKEENNNLSEDNNNLSEDNMSIENNEIEEDYFNENINSIEINNSNGINILLKNN